MKNYRRKIAAIRTNNEYMPTYDLNKKMNEVFMYLSKGMFYNDIVRECKDMTEDEINAILWYFAKKGIRYIPSLS